MLNSKAAKPNVCVQEVVVDRLRPNRAINSMQDAKVQTNGLKKDTLLLPLQRHKIRRKNIFRNTKYTGFRPNILLDFL